MTFGLLDSGAKGPKVREMCESGGRWCTQREVGLRLSICLVIRMALAVFGKMGSLDAYLLLFSAETKLFLKTAQTSPKKRVCSAGEK